MSILSTGFSAIGRLLFIVVLLTAFSLSMGWVIMQSLNSSEVTVPEIVGKDFVESEKELASLGLKLKKRADRPSKDQINTILEQLPRPGETLKQGQVIFVVVSKFSPDAPETPKSLIKDLESDDTEKIEEMISDKPKRQRERSNTNTNTNSNTSTGSNDNRLPETTRDVNSNSSTAPAANTAPKPDNQNTKEPATKPTPGARETITIPIPKPSVPASAANRQSAGSGESRPRAAGTPQP